MDFPVRYVNVYQRVIFNCVNQRPFQEPIHWRYLPYIRPEFQGISPQFIWPNIWYVYVPPSIGSWISHSVNGCWHLLDLAGLTVCSLIQLLFFAHLMGTRWCPPVISWFIIPINYRYNPLINPSYWTYLHQLS